MKAIREGLEELERHATTDCGTAEMAADVRRKHDAARAEVDVMETRLAALNCENNLLARELRFARERNASLERFASQFSSMVESDFSNEEAHGKGGMRVTLTGDFVRLPPFAKSRLRWWAERAKEALKEAK